MQLDSPDKRFKVTVNDNGIFTVRHEDKVLTFRVFADAKEWIKAQARKLDTTRKPIKAPIVLLHRRLFTRAELISYNANESAWKVKVDGKIEKVNASVIFPTDLNIAELNRLKQARDDAVNTYNQFLRSQMGKRRQMYFSSYRKVSALKAMEFEDQMRKQLEDWANVC